MAQDDKKIISRLSEQLEGLTDAFGRLAKAGSVADLARLFLPILMRDSTADAVALCFRADVGHPWECLLGPPSMVSQIELPADSVSTFLFPSRPDGPRTTHFLQPLADRAALAVILGEKQDRNEYSELDRVLLQLDAELFANAYQAMQSRRKEKELVFSLNHRVLQLNSLIDTGIEVTKLGQDASLHRLALERAASVTNASRGGLHIARGESVVEEVTFPSGVSMNGHEGSGRTIESKFTFQENTYTFRLFDKESRRGVVQFDETDQLLLDALTRQVHAALENRYLHQQALEKQRIEHDLSVAASIQQRILPETLPAIDGYDLAGINIPTKSVGGDYYDCIPLPDGKYALVIADVSGKGMPAALLVSSLHAYLGAYLEGGMELVNLAQRLNRSIHRASTDDKFITAFFAILNPASGEIDSLSAGHNPVYLLRQDGTVEELSEGGVALGMLDMDFPFQTNHVVLEKGDRLLLYTDGVTEANNETFELYDSIRPLQQFLASRKPGAAAVFIRDLIGDIKDFCGTASQADDITALYLIRR